jgi:hypothetical protein
MHIIKRLFLFAALLASPLRSRAADVAQTLRQDGKFNTVLVVVGILLAGVVVWLVALDRRVARMEKENTHNGDKA